MPQNDGTGPVEERFHPRIWRRTIPTGVATEIDGTEALKLLPEGQELWMRVDGRMPKPAAQKLNPLWWVVNDWDKVPPDWSLPGNSEWLRAVNWWWRNPFHNMGRYVLGVGDQNYWVHITRRDGYKTLTDSKGFSHQDLYGWEIGELVLDDGAAFAVVRLWVGQGGFLCGLAADRLCRDKAQSARGLALAHAAAPLSSHGRFSRSGSVGLPQARGARLA